MTVIPSVLWLRMFETQQAEKLASSHGLMADCKCNLQSADIIR